MKLDTAQMQIFIDMLRSVIPIVGTGAGIDAEAAGLRRFQDAMKGLEELMDGAEIDGAVKERVSALRGETVAKKAPAKKAAAKKAPVKKAAKKRAR